MERRHFLQLLSLAPASVAAAECLTEDVNLAKLKKEVDRNKQVMLETIDDAERRYVEVRAHACYDLLQIPEGALVPDAWSFFSDPIGAPIRGVCQWCGEPRGVPQLYGKSLLHTNQLRANSFPPPEQHSFDQVVFIFNPRSNERDRADLIENFYFELRVNDRIEARGPIARARVVGEVADLVALDTGRRKQVALDAPFSIPFAVPIRVPMMNHFALTLHGHSFVTRAALGMYAFLDGLGEFAVQ